MEINLQLEVQSAMNCLDEALNALERAYSQAERQERRGEPAAVSTDILERASNAVRTAQRALEASGKPRR
ncbi:hypothetical protein IJT17_07195 [bacterium]|nr:hypothetical protein [bacterium]